MSMVEALQRRVEQLGGGGDASATTARASSNAGGSAVRALTAATRTTGAPVNAINASRSVATLRVDGFDRVCLLDTGAAPSLVRRDVADASPDAPRRKCPIDLHGAFGSATAYEAVRLVVTTPSGVQRYVWHVVVDRFPHEVLLGLDALAGLRVDVLPSATTIRFGAEKDGAHVDVPMGESCSSDAVDVAALSSDEAAALRQLLPAPTATLEEERATPAAAETLGWAPPGVATTPPTRDELAGRIASDLSSEHREQLLDVLERHRDAFAANPKAPGHTLAVQQHAIIETGDASPVCERLRPRSAAQQRLIDDCVAELVKAGIVAPCVSPWASNVQLVGKKDGNVRFCVDYRRLNAITIKDRYPASNVDEALTRLRADRFFSSADCASGFYQIRLDDADCVKTAFVTANGQYCFKVMPFGLVNAPAAWLRFARRRLAPHLGAGAGLELYADDLLFHHSTFEEHLARLDAVLADLARAGPRLSLKKCVFGASSTRFLGHVVSAGGVSIAPEKIAAVLAIPPPRTVGEVRQLLGLANYHRRFIADFAAVTRPIAQLTAGVGARDGGAPSSATPVEWTADCASALAALKTALTSAPTLAHLDATARLVLFTDASDHTIAGTLMQQRDHDDAPAPLEYFSRALTAAERNYSTSEKEALAVVASLQRARHIVLGRHVTVYTDHAALRSLLTARVLAGRLQRWALVLQEYQLTIAHRAGHTMTMVDPLTRAGAPPRDLKTGGGGEYERGASDDVEERLDVAAAASGVLRGLDGRPWTPGINFDGVNDNETDGDNGEIMTLGTDAGVIADDGDDADAGRSTDVVLSALALPAVDVGALQRADAEVAQLLDETHTGRGRYQLFEIIDDVLYHVRDGVADEPGRRALVVPLALRERLLRAAHDDAAAGHLGVEKTLARLRARYWWPTMASEARAHVLGCAACARFSTRGAPPTGFLVNVIAGRPFEIVGVDFVGPLKTTANGFNYILVFVDYFTRWPEAFPVVAADAATCASMLVTEIVSRHGVPVQLISDRGTHFMGALAQETFARLGVRHTPTSPYHQAANGQVERFVQTLKKMLATALDGQDAHWDALLPGALFAYRTAEHTSTGVAPARALYGRDLLAPLDVAGGLIPVDRAPVGPYLHRLRETLAALHDDMREAQHDAQARQARSYDERRRATTLKPGDGVWLRVDAEHGKFEPNWRGPYRVVEMLGPLSVRIADSEDESRGQQVVHVSRLKHNTAGPPGDADADAEQNEYVVDAIVGTRVRDGRKEFKIHWAGYTKRYDSWVDADDVNAPDKIAAYERVQALATATGAAAASAATSAAATSSAATMTPTSSTATSTTASGPAPTTTPTAASVPTSSTTTVPPRLARPRRPIVRPRRLDDTADYERGDDDDG